MVKKRIVDNRNRPAQPEPGQDPATKKKPRRAQETSASPQRPTRNKPTKK